MKTKNKGLLTILTTTILALASTLPMSGQGTWQTKTPIPIGLFYASAGVINGKLYVAAGSASNTQNVATNIYDPLADAWSSGAEIPLGLSGGAAGVIDGKLYVAGGQPYGHNVANLQVYDPATDTWANKASMPEATFGATAGVINGKLYVAGGMNASNTVPVNSLRVYDPTMDTWTTKAPMPTARSVAAGGVINGILYVAGGNATGTDFAVVEAYDPTTDTWTTKASMPAVKSWASSGVINGMLYVAGGTDMNGANTLATVEAYDPSTNSWTTETSMPTARFGPFGGVLNGSLFVVGGTDTANALAKNEAFTPPTVYSAQVQPPINADGSSVFNANRGVVPVKFTLMLNGVATCQLAAATIALTRTAGGTTGSINESFYVMSSDSGSNFRIDNCQYVYNLNSGALGVGIYRVDILINGQVVGSAVFQLR